MKAKVIALLLLILVPNVAGIAWAHGVNIKYNVVYTPSIEIDATFDSGEPMSEAQVTVYAPDDQKNPWLTGTCDEQGHFAFTPDLSKTGTWEVQVRLAGHGEWLRIPVDERMSQTPDATVESGGYTTGQIVLMSGAVIWGLVGTALFFARRKSADSPGAA